MSAVQFKSAEKAIAAFNNTECQAWSVWTGKQLLYKGIGESDLTAFLDLLADSATNAVYTLAYYEEVTDRKKINSKTPFDGSFNFKLNADGMEIENGQYQKFYRNNELLSKVNGLEKKFDDLMEKWDGEPEPGENKLGLIGEILEHKAIAPILPQLLQQMVTKMFHSPTGQQLAPRLAQVAGVPVNQDARLQAAIDRLLKVDPKLPEHLTKLAEMAENEPEAFAYIIAALDSR